MNESEEITLMDNNIEKDKYNSWTEKSSHIPFFKKNHNGEEKMLYELGIENNVKLGGQNNPSDITIPKNIIENFYWINPSGKISIKDMTNDDCRLGVECCEKFNKLKRRILCNLYNWCEEHKDKCEKAKNYFIRLNTKYGKSRNTIIGGIDRGEISGKNYINLCNILNDFMEDVKNNKNSTNSEYDSLKSELVDMIFKELNNKSFEELMNDCVRQEASSNTLIIVDKNKGWLVVNDLKKLSCTRITQNSPRIHYNFN